MFERNVGGVDRAVRAGLAVAFLVVAVVAWSAGYLGVAVVVAGCALVVGVNAATGFCGVNAALGVDTTGRADEQNG